MQFWSVFGGAGSIWGGTGWCLVELVQYNLVLPGFKWNWVSTRLVCLYILKKKWRFGQMLPWRDKRPNKQGKKELLNQWTMNG